MKKPVAKIGFSALAAIFILVAALSGCQQLFTTSLAKGLARDEIKLPDTLTTNQAADLAQEAKENDDQTLAKAVVGTLVDQVTNPAFQPELAAAAASAAITASGASGALLEALATAMSEDGEIDPVVLLATIQEGASADVVEALGFLVDIGDPSALESTELGATDYLMAAVIVAASAFPAGADPTDPDTYDVDEFESSDGYIAAVAILGQAIALVEPGSESADLMDQISGMFQI